MILPRPFVHQPRIAIDSWILITIGVIVLGITLPFTIAAFQIKP